MSKDISVMHKPWTWDLGLWTVVLIGVMLRFHALDRQSLWNDEMTTMQTISGSVTDQIERHRHFETHPPLYFLQLRPWRAVFGSSLAALRANSAFWGSLSLMIFFLIARRYARAWPALLFLTFSPLHLLYSQEARPYALCIFLMLVSWWTLEEYIVGAGPSARPEKTSAGIFSKELAGRHGSLPLQVFLWTCLLYTHYWGAFVVCAEAAYAYFSVETMKRRQIVIAFFVAGLLFIPWLPILWDQLHLGFWVPPASIANLWRTFIAYTGLSFKAASADFHSPGPWLWRFLCGVLWFVCAFVGFVRGPKSARWLLSIGLLLPWLISYFQKSIFVWYRYPVIFYPAFLLIAASGWSALRWRHRWGILPILLASQLFGCWTYFSGWQKANPKQVMAYVRMKRDPQTVIVRPAYFSALFNFYNPDHWPAIDEHLLDDDTKRNAYQGQKILLISFDEPADPIRDALLQNYSVESAITFPGFAHLAITVYELR
jgi:mannosyltransferase